MDLRLRNGDRVGIVGGGPAGSFSALHLARLARQMGLELDILLYEPRDFYATGTPRTCKGCAGIISANTLRDLASIGLTLPSAVVQSELSAYELHVAGQVAQVQQPVAGRRIASVYRGNGPRGHQGAPVSSFDGYLLAQAIAAGARHVPARVRRVSWEGGPYEGGPYEGGPCQGRPVLHTGEGSQSVDLLVLANGVNVRSPLDPAFGYRPGASAVMAQDEVLRPPDWPEHKVAGFFGQPAGLLFGALVPKGDYLNVSLLWRAGSTTHAIEDFYRAQAGSLGRLLPDSPQGLCGCRPRMLLEPAQVFFGDRWVAVGDAAVSHLYKDGIHSAFVTASAAARCAVQTGVAGRDFRQVYAPTCRRIAADNRYGAFLYSSCARLLELPRFAAAFLGAVQSEAGLPYSHQLHTRLLWGMLTGDEPYSALLRIALRPDGILALARRGLGTGGRPRFNLA
jgi:flavin-dependent dehydrogenase